MSRSVQPEEINVFWQSRSTKGVKKEIAVMGLQGSKKIKYSSQEGQRVSRSVQHEKKYLSVQRRGSVQASALSQVS